MGLRKRMRRKANEREDPVDDFELYLDTADIDAIKELDQILNVQGVTTNPSILAKTGEDPLVAVQKIIDYFDPEQKIFMQVVSTDLQGILDEAHFIASLRPKNMCPKIPVSHNGLKAIKQLESEGIQCLATSIYSADAGFMAAHNGAKYLAPYVNRMCNYGGGMQDVCDLVDMLAMQNSKTKVLGASFKNTDQVHALIAAGMQAVTLPVDVAYNMIGHPGVKIAVDEFTANWQKAYGRTTLRA